YQNFIASLLPFFCVFVALVVVGFIFLFFKIYFCSDEQQDIAPGLMAVPIEQFIFRYPERKYSICLGKFESNLPLANTVCGHAFHFHCLSEWNNTCPVCRTILF
ncbi:unnamed protein product, partial [Arabidopsis halleri]